MARNSAVLALAFLIGTAAHAQAAQERPNIILIMADDIGYECFGCYGSEQYKTPMIDSLAEGGMRFRHAYSQPLCTPSRVKLMTGLSNVRNYSAFSVLNHDQKTFAHFLGEAGYRTAVAGKWQLYGAEHYSEQFRAKGALPADAGFQSYCLWQVQQLGQRYDAPLLNIDGTRRQFEMPAYGPEIATDDLLDFMARQTEQPFLVYYPMILVHSPFVPTPDTLDRTTKNRQSNFEDMVAYMDKLVGRIVRKTEQLGIADRTLVLFTGDNGTHKSIKSTLQGEVIVGGKGKTTDAGTRVPLVAYWPGKIAPGQVTDCLVEFSDFLPTMFEAAGVDVPEAIDGQSFYPQLMGSDAPGRDSIYVYYNPRPEKTEPVAFARDQRYKLYDDGRFYDVASDTLERQPLTGTLPPTAAAAKKKLRAKLDTMPRKGQTLLQFPR